MRASIEMPGKKWRTVARRQPPFLDADACVIDTSALRGSTLASNIGTLVALYEAEVHMAGKNKKSGSSGNQQTGQGTKKGK
jgi:hypothetical protein